MNQGMSMPPAVARAQQQQAFLNKLRIDIVVGLHRELVAKTFSFGPQCLPGDEWKLQSEGEPKDGSEDGSAIKLQEMRRAVARESIAQAETLMGELGFIARREEPDGPG